MAHRPSGHHASRRTVVRHDPPSASTCRAVNLQRLATGELERFDAIVTARRRPIDIARVALQSTQAAIFANVAARYVANIPAMKDPAIASNAREAYDSLVRGERKHTLNHCH